MSTTINYTPSTNQEINNQINNQNNSNLTINSKVLYETVSVTDRTINQKLLLFINCKFIGIFNFDNLNFSGTIVFNNCTFEKDLNIKNCTFPKSSYNLKNANTETYSINFVNCNLSSDLNITFTIDENIIDNHINGISINNCIGPKEFYIKNAYVKYNGIKISNLKNTRYVEIQNSYIAEILEIDDSSFETLIADNSFFYKLELSNNKFSDLVHFYECHIDTSIILYRNEFNSELGLILLPFASSDKENKKINIINNIFKQVIISPIVPTDHKRSKSLFKHYDEDDFIQFSHILITQCDIRDRFILGNALLFDQGDDLENQIDSEKLIRFQINSLELRCSASLKGQIFLSEADFEKILLKGSNPSTHISITNSKFNSIIFNGFFNTNKVQIMNCVSESDGILKILNSSLGHTFFFNFDFSVLKNVFIINSVINEVNFNNVIWFSQEQLICVESIMDDDKHRKYREVYRQLKYATDKQLDKIQSLRFQSYEMSSHRKELKLRSKNVQNIFTLLINSISGHGINWLTPALLSLFITFIFYIIILTLINNINYNINNFIPIKSLIVQNIGSFWQMLNPIYNTRVIFDVKTISGLIGFLEILHKIIVSILIFQTITAFRKYNK